MQHCEYNYNDLSEKYHNFSLPSILIKIDGKKVETLLAIENQIDTSLILNSVKVNLSLEKPSMAQIRVLNVYNYSDGTINQVATIGSKIEIFLGYVDSNTVTKVFHGYIARLDYEFQNNISILITALDVLNLMQQEFCPKYYISQSYDDIVNDILDKYSLLITEKSLDTLSTSKEFIHREEKVSDLDFVRRLCFEHGKMFFVSNETAYITDKFGDKPIINLDIHESLKSFTFSKIYQNSKIKVVGFDTENHDNEIVGESTFELQNCNKITTLPQTKVVTMSNINTPTDATNYAQYLAKNISNSVYLGNINCLGLPEITVGRTITVSNVDKSTFDTYNFNITEVTHTFDNNGFNTNITINGWS